MIRIERRCRFLPTRTAYLRLGVKQLDGVENTASLTDVFGFGAGVTGVTGRVWLGACCS